GSTFRKYPETRSPGAFSIRVRVGSPLLQVGSLASNSTTIKINSCCTASTPQISNSDASYGEISSYLLRLKTRSINAMRPREHRRSTSDRQHWCGWEFA